MASLTHPAPPVKARRACQRRQHVRCAVVAVPASPETFGAALVRLTQDGTDYRYWVKPIPSDFGAAFSVEKSVLDGEDAYDVLLDGELSSCTCPGNVYHGYCKHADCCRALVAAGKLTPAPKPDLHEGASYKPGHDSDLAF